METFYTDGASNKKGAGGAFIHLEESGRVHDRKSFSLPEGTTSQQAELLAVIAALDDSEVDGHVKIYTDSQYVTKGFEGEWDLTKNLDLWEALNLLARNRREVEIIHIPRRSDQYARQADNLAKAACGREA